MSCNLNKFTLTRGRDNVYTFVIKQNDSTLPMEIVAGDTFTMSLLLLSDSSEVLTKPMVAIDLLSGKVELTLTEAELAGLEVDKGSKADRYYSRPLYKIVVDCVTVNSGNFLFKVEEVYVD